MNSEIVQDILDTNIIKSHITNACYELWDEYGYEFSEDEIKLAIQETLDDFDFTDLSFYEHMNQDEVYPTFESVRINENNFPQRRYGHGSRNFKPSRPVVGTIIDKRRNLEELIDFYNSENVENQLVQQNINEVTWFVNREKFDLRVVTNEIQYNNFSILKEYAFESDYDGILFMDSTSHRAWIVLTELLQEIYMHPTSRMYKFGATEDTQLLTKSFSQSEFAVAILRTINDNAATKIVFK